MSATKIHKDGLPPEARFFLITSSAVSASFFIKNSTEWTVWIVLALFSLWDLFAVLHSKGPLRVLIETAQERNEPIFPSFIYSNGVQESNKAAVMSDSLRTGNEIPIKDKTSSSKESTPYTSNGCHHKECTTAIVKRVTLPSPSASMISRPRETAKALNYAELENQTLVNAIFP